MNKQTRLYNVLFPLWMLFLFPQIWLIVLPGNLLIDCAVVLITLMVLKHPHKGAVLKQCWWKLLLLGFAADFVGVAFLLAMMFVQMLPIPGLMDWWDDWLSPIMHNPFLTLPAFVCMLAAVALAGYCIYRFDRKVLAACPELSDREGHIVALTLAIATAPWLFFIPMY